MSDLCGSLGRIDMRGLEEIHGTYFDGIQE